MTAHARLTIALTNEVRSFDLHKSLSFGNGRSCDVRLRHRSIAEQHCRLEITDGVMVLQVSDGQEVLVNGEACSGAELEVGDNFQVGPYLVKVEAPQAAKAPVLPIVAGVLGIAVVVLSVLLLQKPGAEGGPESAGKKPVEVAGTSPGSGAKAGVPGDGEEPTTPEDPRDGGVEGGEVPGETGRAEVMAGREEKRAGEDEDNDEDKGEAETEAMPKPEAADPKKPAGAGGEPPEERPKVGGESKQAALALIDLTALDAQLRILETAGRLEEARTVVQEALAKAPESQKLAVQVLATRIDNAIATRDEAAWKKRKAEIEAAYKAREAWEGNGREIQELAGYLEHKNWSFRALGAVALLSKHDPRSVAPVLPALDDKSTAVRLFAIAGLGRLPFTEIKSALRGYEVMEDLIAKMSKNKAVKAKTIEALTKFAGSDLKSPTAWKRWLEEQKSSFVPSEKEPFDFSGFSREELARYDREQSKDAAASGATGTTVLRGEKFKSALEEMSKNGLEIMICLDVTGSMGGVLAESKKKVETLTMILANLVGNIRIGLVTYRDQVATKVPLTANWAVFKKALDGQQASGGDDFPEGVEKGVEACLREAGWKKKSTKAIVIIGDAPPHPEDLGRFDELADFAKKNGVTFHGLYTTGEVKDIADRVTKTGGGNATLGNDANFLKAFLLLIFGKDLEPYLKDFIEIYLELAEDLK